MIGLDSNVLIRFLANDEPQQADQAKQLMTALTPDNPGYISLVALIETIWVLKHHFHSSRDHVFDVIETVLDVPSLVVQGADDVRAAISDGRRGGVDLPDALLACLNLTAGCEVTMTFDRRAVRLPSMQLITVPPPDGQ